MKECRRDVQPSPSRMSGHRLFFKLLINTVLQGRWLLQSTVNILQRGQNYEYLLYEVRANTLQYSE